MGTAMSVTEGEQLVRGPQGIPLHLVLWGISQEGSRIQEWSHCDCSLSYGQKEICLQEHGIPARSLAAASLQLVL